MLYGLAGSASLAAGRAVGLAVASEAFLDRTYQPDGTLTPRVHPGAFVKNVDTAVDQARQLVFEGRVRAMDGTWISVRADTLCIHGDGPHAVEFAQNIRAALLRDGIKLKPASGAR